MAAIMILIVLGVAVLIAYPLLKPQLGKEFVLDDTEDARGVLMKRKESSYTAIKELDFDYRTGKLSDEDYQSLYNIYMADALKAIQSLEEGKWPDGESAELEEEGKLSEEEPLEAVKDKLPEGEIMRAGKEKWPLRKLVEKELEEEILRRRAKPSQGISYRYCQECGSRCESKARFCRQCGASLAPMDNEG